MFFFANVACECSTMGLFYFRGRIDGGQYLSFQDDIAPKNVFDFSFLYATTKPNCALLDYVLFASIYYIPMCVLCSLFR